MKVLFIDRGDREKFLPLLMNNNIVHDKSCIMFGAVENNSPIGVIVLTLNEGIMDLEWIYVVEKYRHKKVGTALIKMAVLTAKKFEILAIKFETTMWSEKLETFFEKNDFIMCPEEPVYLISKENATSDMRCISILKKAPHDDTVPVKELGVMEVKALRAFLEKEPLGKKLLDNVKMDLAASFVHKNEEGNIDACIICSKYNSDICIDFIHSVQGSEHMLLSLIRAVFLFVKNDANAVENILFYAANPKIYSLAHTLFTNGIIEEAGPVFGFLGLE